MGMDVRVTGVGREIAAAGWIGRALALLLLCMAWAQESRAQGMWEFATGQGGPTNSGPLTTPQTVAMRLNTDNPGGNTFTNAANPVSVTFSWSLVQGNDVPRFGANDFPNGTTVQGVPIFREWSLSSGSPVGASTLYSSGSAAGSGHDLTANAGLRTFATATRGAGANTTNRIRQADLTIAFSRPVTNPVLHLVGLGETNGTVNGLGYSVEFNRVSPTSATFTLLSGTNLAVTASQINNSRSDIDESCDSGAACGSVRVNGTFSTLVLRMFVRGDGTPGATYLGTNTGAGDSFGLGVSVPLVADLSITNTNTPGVNNDVDQAADTVVAGEPVTYTLVVRNGGPDVGDGAVLRNPAPTGVDCLSVTCDGATGGAACPGGLSVAALQSAAGVTLATLPPSSSLTFSLGCTVQ
ncbi:DUF11 domain-containing protein [Lysobacter sp. SG-8]|uniref:DUF11 domain-containing protein n=1 Tax=Marilutibacter penaei TaxID=2759900 RepID=A0A7W3U517_9GAMM|nr:DUF11 domain-containing protein [Lysobacter penaei]MBB1089008.1 DUF11 domain-containing protein [Lysobacter penaei]